MAMAKHCHCCSKFLIGWALQTKHISQPPQPGNIPKPIKNTCIESVPKPISPFLAPPQNYKSIHIWYLKYITFYHLKTVRSNMTHSIIFFHRANHNRTFQRLKTHLLHQNAHCSCFATSIESQNQGKQQLQQPKLFFFLETVILIRTHKYESNIQSFLNRLIIHYITRVPLKTNFCSLQFVTKKFVTKHQHPVSTKYFIYYLKSYFIYFTILFYNTPNIPTFIH